MGFAINIYSIILNNCIRLINATISLKFNYRILDFELYTFIVYWIIIYKK